MKELACGEDTNSTDAENALKYCREVIDFIRKWSHLQRKKSRTNPPSSKNIYAELHPTISAPHTGKPQWP